MPQFHEVFQDYLKRYNITQKQLSKICDISASTLNRYYTGTRKPAYDSEQIHAIAFGIAKLSGRQDIDALTIEIVDSLHQTLTQNPAIDYTRFLANTIQLLDLLNIKHSELAKAANYDPSHISKILSGSRRPGDMTQFVETVAEFAAQKCQLDNSSYPILEWIGAKPEDITSSAAFQTYLIHWLTEGHITKKDHPISHFLGTLDSFDLNKYIRTIHFDEMKIPSTAFYRKTNKTYYGIQKMMESELEFLKTTVLSKSMEDCIFYSDMPMEQMSKDPEFPKKWMYGMGMLLKKGLHLHLIHDVNRPFPEMMLGLESHIPMYMTGQISPYYLPSTENHTFNHLIKVSGSAALIGSAIAGHQDAGKYELYRTSDDVEHYKQRARDLLKKAKPLMDIYTLDQKDAWTKKVLLKTFHETQRRMVCSTMPIFTLSKELLDDILESAALTEKQKQEICDYHQSYRQLMRSLLEKGCHIHVVLPSLTEEEFEQYPLHLHISDIFMEAPILYTYEQYQKNMAEIEEHDHDFENMTVEINNNQIFRNINYTIIPDTMVIVSKATSPAIHFVIHHKKMVEAFQSFIPPITDL